jgi:hypothetical protein
LAVAGTATLEPKQRMFNIEHATSNVQVNGEATKGRTPKEQGQEGSGIPQPLIEAHAAALSLGH